MGMLVNPHRHLAAAAADTMEGLFANGEIGDYWHFDAANTDGNLSGDPVTVATGLVNGLLMEDADPANVPNLTSTTESTSFAPQNDRLFINFGSTVPQPGTIIVSITSESANTAKAVYSGSSALLRWQLSIDGSGNIIGYAGTALDSTRDAAFGTKVVTVEFNGASSLIRFNGTTLATGNIGTQGTDQFTLGALYDGSNGIGIGAWDALFINRLLTPTERDVVERLFGSHAGLSW